MWNQIFKNHAILIFIERFINELKIDTVLTADHNRNTDDFKIIAAAFDIRTSSWSSAFSFWGNWFDVKTTNWQTNNQRYVNVVPASLLLNQDKSFRAFGYEAEEQYDDAEDDEKRDFFFVQRITTAFESSMDLVRTFVLNCLLLLVN